jgi:hypothetical protein
MNKPLSPAAQAVKDAAFSAYWSAEQEAPNDAHVIAAAALRAAADQVAPEVYFSYTDHRDWDKGMEAKSDEIREAILVIAAELEGNR